MAPEVQHKFVMRLMKLGRKFGMSYSLTHFVIVDLPAFKLIMLAIFLDLHTHSLITILGATLWLFDCIANWIILTDNEVGINQSVEPETVELLANTRILNLQFNDPANQIMLSEADEKAGPAESEHRVTFLESPTDKQTKTLDDVQSAFDQTNLGDVKSEGNDAPEEVVTPRVFEDNLKF